MIILVSHQAVPPHFTTKLRPWLWQKACYDFAHNSKEWCDDL